MIYKTSATTKETTKLYSPFKKLEVSCVLQIRSIKSSLNRQVEFNCIHELFINYDIDRMVQMVVHLM